MARDAFGELEQQLGEEISHRLATTMRDAPAYREKVLSYVGTPCLYCRKPFRNAREVEQSVTAPIDEYLFLAHRSCHPKTA